MYGGLPFENARPVVRLSLPVVQVRDVAAGETVGYSNTWQAETETRIATVAAGYADGLLRTLSSKATLWAGDTPCPLIGRVSMDLITVDVTHLKEIPRTLDILGPLGCGVQTGAGASINSLNAAAWLPRHCSR